MTMQEATYYQNILDEIYQEIKNEPIEGDVADYIPALAQVNNNKFGMSISTLNGKDYAVGDSAEPFSTQSISKVFSLALALKLGKAEDLWKRVGVEPSGNAFNSLSQLEYENGKPRNPFINAGALVITDYLISHQENLLVAFLDFVQTLAGDKSIKYDKNIFHSEWSYGHRNAAMVHYLYSFNKIKNEVHVILNNYFHQCALSMSCIQLSRALCFLANDGRITSNVESVLTKSQNRRVCSLMMTCGMYDESGQVAFDVGLPCKSGVGGGIVAVVPGQMVISVWSPPLGSKGNSILGIKALKLFCQKTELAIF